MVSRIFFLLVCVVCSKYIGSSASCLKGQFSCGDGTCIQREWRCDGGKDCSNNLDELNCPNKTSCKNDEFQCKSKPLCIPIKWKCDNEPDCEDGEDEDPNVCANITSCKNNEFQCKSKPLCIPIKWKCDNEPDCEHGEDEDPNVCANKTSCKNDEFQCESKPKCIPIKWKCDNDSDCEHGEDEDPNICKSEKKNPVGCSDKEFACDDGKSCIHSSWRCDGDADCPDKSDEKNCTHSCKISDFRCADDECISSSLRCDGKADCQNASDEKNCTTSTVAPTCGPDTLGCHTSEGWQCLNGSKVCDGINDCRNLLDETNCSSSGINQCEQDNGGCQQVCVKEYGNEHRCECHPGFRKIGNHSCEGKHPELLIASRNNIRSLQLNTWIQSIWLDEFRSIVSVDYDYNDEYVFWSDVALETINRVRRLHNGTNVGSNQPIISTNVKTPDGIAVDWIYNHLYWTDTGNDRIEVSDYDGNMRKTLVTEGLDEPRAIVVDPTNGWMYWSDWGDNPKITRCGMNGYPSEELITDNIRWPNGLTLDFVDQKLFWVDAKLHTIETSDVDGKNRRTVLDDPHYIQHPFSIAVFEDNLYWSDWNSNSIGTINKFRGDGYQKVGSGYFSPMGVRIYHENVQYDGINYCGKNNGGCTQLCLPAPDVSGAKLDMQKFTCACADGFTLSSDRKTCLSVSPTTTDASIPGGSTTSPITRSDITCNGDDISVYVPMDLLPMGRSVTWRDPDCAITNNGTHYVGTVDFNHCGTTVRFNDDSVEFRNELISHSSNHHDTPANAVIDFGDGFDSVVPVECVYPRKENAMASYLPVQGQVRFFEKRMGHLDLELQQVEDQTFTVPVAQGSFPPRVHLNNNFYIKVSSNHMNRSDVGIHLDNCVATPSASPADSTFQPLIKNGCPSMPSVTVYQSPVTEARVGIRAFQFSSHPAQTVYIHCEVSVCPVTDSQCTAGCVASSRQRRAAEPGQKRTSHLLSAGPYILMAEEGSVQVATVVAGICGCIAIVATTFAVVMWRKQRELAAKTILE